MHCTPACSKRSTMRCWLLAAAAVLLSSCQLTGPTHAVLLSGPAGHTLTSSLSIHGDVNVIDSAGTSTNLLEIIQQQAAIIQQQQVAAQQQSTVLQQQAAILQQQTAAMQAMNATLFQAVLQLSMLSVSNSVVYLPWGSQLNTAPAVGTVISFGLAQAVRGSGVSCTATTCTFTQAGLFQLYANVPANGADARVDYSWMCPSVPAGGACVITHAQGKSFTSTQNVAPYEAWSMLRVTEADAGLIVSLRVDYISGTIDQYFAWIIQQ
jgi:hypothetical protein